MDETVKALLSPIVTLFVGLLGVYFAHRASKAASAAVHTTRALANTTQEMSGRLDGKLDELKELWQQQAHAEGYSQAQEEGRAEALRIAIQVKADAIEMRQQAREDRAEGAGSGSTSTPMPVIVTNPDPVPVVVDDTPEEKP